MSTADLTSVRASVEILQLCRQRIAEFNELAKTHRGIIEEAMGQHDVGLVDGEPVVHWSHYKENRFDQSAFGAEYPDLLEQFKAAKEKRRFEVLDV